MSTAGSAGSDGLGRDPDRPRRSRKLTQAVLEPLSWGIARAPLLPIEAYPAVVRGDTVGEGLLPADPRVSAALAVGTDHLFAALERTRGSAPEAPRLRARLLRYMMRMTTRPTPFGLFAGVGLIEWGSTTDAALTAHPVRTRARPDMGWLLDLVMELERDPEVRRELRLFTNPLAWTRAGWVFLSEQAHASDSLDLAAPDVSVRATAATQRVLALARTPTAYVDLVTDLLARPGATRDKVEGLIDELWRHSLLLTDLRPPLTGVPPGHYVLERLRTVPAARSVHEALGALLDVLDRWDALPLEERADGWAALMEQAARVHRPSGFASARAVQVDMALPLTGRRVHLEVAKEAAVAAELLLRMSPHPFGPPHLQAYRLRFEARYGSDREVPLMELLNPEFGLGPPDEEDHRWHPRQQSPDIVRHRTLFDLAVDTLRERRMIVELDDDLLERLKTWVPTTDAVPRSLDIAVFVAAASSAAVDAGDFTVIVGPNLGADAAGRTLGRFAGLLGPEAHAALETAASHAEADNGRLSAELVYLPQRTRLANVAVRSTGVDHQIVCGTTPGVPADQIIPLDELVVAIRDGRFCIRWSAINAEIAVSETHMLNSLHAPPELLFLQEVERDRRVVFDPFSWGPAAEFPFLPRVQRGRVVLALARWRIGEASELRTPVSAFPDALRAWRERWSVPRHVYLSDADRRLLLDLENPAHADVLREELGRQPAADVAVLEEALPGPSDAWLPGPDGCHIVELVVPLAARSRLISRTENATPVHTAAPVAPLVRFRPPGSDWLFLKLYCPPAFHDQLITDELAPFAEFARSASLAGSYFFVRYRDPEPHLRIRFHGEPDVLLSGLLPKVCRWAASLVADGTCSRFVLDTYEREVERYGGTSGVNLAESLFVVDSRAAVTLLRLVRDLPTIDQAALAVLSVDALLDGLGAGPLERLDVYRVAALSRADGHDYRQRQEMLRRLLAHGPAAEPGGDELARVLDERRRALEPIASQLDAGAGSGELNRDKAALFTSYVHMHCNRLLGIEPRLEERVLQLARRTSESLLRAPVAPLKT
jgi:thiopeptide-type bacteriocin biosynthesis protein